MGPGVGKASRAPLVESLEQRSLLSANSLVNIGALSGAVTEPTGPATRVFKLSLPLESSLSVSTVGGGGALSIAIDKNGNNSIDSGETLYGASKSGTGFKRLAAGPYLVGVSGTTRQVTFTAESGGQNSVSPCNLGALTTKGLSATGWVGASWSLSYYSFRVTAPTMASISVDPASAARVSLMDVTGGTVWQYLPSAISWQLYPSIYRVAVRTASKTAQGNFRLLIQPTLGTPPAPIPPGPTVYALGDSITWGSGPTDPPIPGGYRQRLYDDLTGAGVSFGYVGTHATNASPALLAAGEARNDGHPGYRIDQLESNLHGWTGAWDAYGGYWLDGGIDAGRPPLEPDYILLMAGTNDIIQHTAAGYPNHDAPESVFMTQLEQRIEALVGDLATSRPSAHVLVASILPIQGFINANGIDCNVEAQEYNRFLEHDLIPTLAAKGLRVTFVDQYSKFVNADGKIRTDLIPGPVHPGKIGYDIMGDAWAAALLPLMSPGTASHSSNART